MKVSLPFLSTIVQTCGIG